MTQKFCPLSPMRECGSWCGWRYDSECVLLRIAEKMEKVRLVDVR